MLIEEDTLIVPGVTPPLDAHFRPLVLTYHAFQADVRKSGGGVPLVIGLERSSGQCSRFETRIFSITSPLAARNLPMVERLVKTLLWARGGWKIYLGGPTALGEALGASYCPTGARAFDAAMMARIYEHPFTIVPCADGDVPAAQEPTRRIGGHLAGCRIGFDAGASDRKVAAVLDGTVVYSEEVVWDPCAHADPQYHHDEIMTALRTAAAHLPRVDAIGVSAAGVYVQNRVRAASLFRGVPDDRFTPDVSELFVRLQREWGNLPLEVINDGDVTALAGAMSLNTTAVLGVALGSSEAAGYVTPDGSLTTWMNELAFVPIDAHPLAPVDEWSGDRGCGVQYLSQQAVGRLISAANLPIDAALSLPERLKALQQLATNGDERVRPLYETIGVYLGYALAHYAEFYDFRYALILGRVTSGDGGVIIQHMAERVLRQEFPALAARVSLQMPTEANRRVGQAIAAASLPQTA